MAECIKIDLNKEVAYKLLALRKNRKLTQNTVSEQAKIPQSRISAIEKGSKTITFEEVSSLKPVLGLKSLDDLELPTQDFAEKYDI